MKHGSNTKRSRNGRGGRNSGQHSNSRGKVFDSNGPDVRIRGNASQVHEKYVALARDAASSGDNILAESYLQHAEHYQRVLNEVQAPRQQPQPTMPPKENTMKDQENTTTDQKADNNTEKSVQKPAPRQRSVKKPEMA